MRRGAARHVHARRRGHAQAHALNFINADGHPIMQGIELPVPVTLPDDAHFLTRNFIVNIQQLKFAEPGLYSVDVRLDDESQASIPLLVKLVERPVA
jgi:hypothetical protein